jgi:hypothetical protein
MNTISKLSIAAITLASLAGAGLADDKTKPADMQMPKPSKELIDLGKNMTGTWKCTGKAYMAGKPMDMTGTMITKTEMDGMWIHEAFDTKMGTTPFHFDAYTTYDANAKKWNRIMIENSGAYSTGWSDGAKANKVDWELTTHGPMGEGKFKDHIDMSDLKKGVKAWGEMSTDGKKWDKVYEQTCTK